MAETVGSLLAEGRGRLAAASFRPPPREASLLLGRLLGRGEAALLAHPESAVTTAVTRRFRSLLERRLAGEPIAYIVGEREFYGRSFKVDPRVLIPRPETEHLIEAALDRRLPPRPTILDLGTGSGCVAVTLALERPESRVVATDLSPAALAVAAANVAAHSVADRVRLVAADLASAIDLARFDLVVGNPPYIDPAEARSLSIEVTRFEPRAALFAPGRGDSILERLARELHGLRPGTPILLEIGHDQGGRIAELAAAHALALEEIRPDLAGHPRIATLTAT